MSAHARKLAAFEAVMDLWLASGRVRADRQSMPTGSFYAPLWMFTLACLRIADGDLCFQRRQADIGALLGYSARSIKRFTRELKRLGILRRISAHHGGLGWEAAVWQLSLERLRELAAEGEAGLPRSRLVSFGLPSEFAGHFMRGLH